jgi:hypothetical protein
MENRQWLIVDTETFQTNGRPSAMPIDDVGESKRKRVPKKPLTRPILSIEDYAARGAE